MYVSYLFLFFHDDKQMVVKDRHTGIQDISYILLAACADSVTTHLLQLLNPHSLKKLYTIARTCLDLVCFEPKDVSSPVRRALRKL